MKISMYCGWDLRLSFSKYAHQRWNVLKPQDNIQNFAYILNIDKIQKKYLIVISDNECVQDLKIILKERKKLLKLYAVYCAKWHSVYVCITMLNWEKNSNNRMFENFSQTLCTTMYNCIIRPLSYTTAVVHMYI